MHLGEELLVLGILFILAYIFGRLGKLIGLPAIPIYMLVGLVASPNFDLFPLNFDPSYVELIAVFGLILLLFNLGLEFDQDEFFSNAGKLLLSGGTYIAVNMGVGLAFGFMLGWGSREALVVAGITATSSSAIVTKLLIELKRLPNRETPMILGVTVVEDIFIAIYLAIVSVVLSGETEIWPVVGKLGVAFLFVVVMFTVARWGGKYVSRIFRTKDDELFTILFFGLAVAFGGIGELLGVTDAIGAFLIGLVLGATKYRAKIEQLSLPMRDVFGAFFFLNFGLGLNPSLFGQVLWPVAGAVLMTLVLNIIAGQFVAWLNKLGPQAGINTTVILQNRGEFALILATLAMAAGLDDRIVPFAGLYVLVMSIFGPILASNSERIGGVILGTNRKRAKALASRERNERDRMNQEAIALVAAATSGTLSEGSDDGDGDGDEEFDNFDPAPADMAAFVRTHSGGDRAACLGAAGRDSAGLGAAGRDSAGTDPAGRDAAGKDSADSAEDDAATEPNVVDRLIQQAMEQSDQQDERKTDPEY